METFKKEGIVDLKSHVSFVNICHTLVIAMLI